MANPQFAVLSLTEAAAERARELIETAGRPVAGLRVGVKKGGCAGMTYTMDLAEEVQAADQVIEDQGVKILIAPQDLMFLLGTKLDFETTHFAGELHLSESQPDGSLRLRRIGFDHPGGRGSGRGAFEPYAPIPFAWFLPGFGLCHRRLFTGLTVVGRNRNMGTWSPMPITGGPSSFS